MTIVRGCGTRDAGKLYFSVPLSAEGTPVWDRLLDPPIPYYGDKFRGVHVAPPDYTEGWQDDTILLLDMVGVQYYPTVACFMEEIRVDGLSRNAQATFDFSQLEGKDVYLGLIHWRGMAEWDEEKGLPEFWYRYCKTMRQKAVYDTESEHYPDCAFHGWPLAYRYHPVEWDDFRQCDVIAMPGFKFDPLNVVEMREIDRQIALTRAAKLPLWKCRPAMFAMFQIPMIEAICWFPETSNVNDSGLEVKIVDE